MRVQLKGLREVKAALRARQSAVDDAAQDAISEAALSLEAGVKTKIQRGPATGRIYQKYSPRRTHQASAPGQAPATDTGALVASIYADIGGMSATVGSRLAYSSYLEYGTRTIAPRPVWTPETERIRGEISDMFKRNLAEAIK